MRSRNLILASFAMLVLFSCSKKSDDKAPKAVTIEGIWVGKYSVLSEPYNAFYSFKIKANGVLELLNAAEEVTGTGTWELENGNLFIGTYTWLPPGSKTFSVLATFKKDTGELDGTWGPDDNDYTGGYWYMEKKN
jgi:hypothetical protein